MRVIPIWVWVVLAVAVVIGAIGWFMWFEMLNSPGGERYQKWRTQGPFVPTDDPERK